MGCFTGSGTAAPGTEKKKQKKTVEMLKAVVL